MKKTLIAAAVATALSISGNANAGVVTVIDLFTTQQTPVVDGTIDGTGSVSQNAVAASDIIGGYRDIAVLKVGGEVDSFLQTKMSISSSGYLSFSNDTGVIGKGMVRWDGSAAATDYNSAITFGLNESFNPFTGTAFELRTIKSDADYKITFEAYTSANQWSKLTLNAHAVANQLDGNPSGNPGNVADDPLGVASHIPLLSLTGLIPGGACNTSGMLNGEAFTLDCGTGGAVDWFNLKAMQVLLNSDGATLDVDLRLNQVTLVPEPASLALVGLGLLGVGAIRRRRSAK